MPKTEPVSPLAMDLGQVLNSLIEAQVGFVLSFGPDDGSDRLFRAVVGNGVCVGPDPVGALVGAAAKTIRKVEPQIKSVRELADKQENRLSKLQELIPGVRAHVPNDKGICVACGHKHEGAVDKEQVSDAINSLRLAMGFAVNDQDEGHEDN